MASRMKARTWAPREGRTKWLPWREAVRVAILRECARANSGAFTVESLSRNELHWIWTETATVSDSPESLLRKNLMQLNRMGEISRIGWGRYRLTTRFRIPHHWTG